MESLCWTCARCRDLPDPAGCIKTRTMWEQLPEGIEIVTKQSPRRDHDNISPYISRKVQRCPQYVRVSGDLEGLSKGRTRSKGYLHRLKKKRLQGCYTKGGERILRWHRFTKWTRTHWFGCCRRRGYLGPNEERRRWGEPIKTNSPSPAVSLLHSRSIQGRPARAQGRSPGGDYSRVRGPDRGRVAKLGSDEEHSISFVGDDGGEVVG